jgi:hypothetical protein
MNLSGHGKHATQRDGTQANRQEDTEEHQQKSPSGAIGAKQGVKDKQNRDTSWYKIRRVPRGRRQIDQHGLEEPLSGRLRYDLSTLR